MKVKQTDGNATLCSEVFRNKLKALIKFIWRIMSNSEKLR